jgi:hypothetical protein
LKIDNKETFYHRHLHITIKFVINCWGGEIKKGGRRRTLITIDNLLAYYTKLLYSHGKVIINYEGSRTWNDLCTFNILSSISGVAEDNQEILPKNLSLL